jgi:hypothetical protein
MLKILKIFVENFNLLHVHICNYYHLYVSYNNSYEYINLIILQCNRRVGSFTVWMCVFVSGSNQGPISLSPVFLLHFLESNDAKNLCSGPGFSHPITYSSYFRLNR